MIIDYTVLVIPTQSEIIVKQIGILFLQTLCWQTTFLAALSGVVLNKLNSWHFLV